MAPDFTMPSTEGFIITLSALRPAPVVLFFYPRDNTTGCTNESQQFSKLAPEYDKAGTKVYGVSKDSMVSHHKFIAKQSLAINLLSDEKSDVCEQFGVWAEKKMYGKSFMGIVRTTFLINGDGCVSRKWPKVKIEGHAAEVLEAVKSL